MGLLNKLKVGLKKTRDSLGSMLSSVFSGGKKVDEELLEELEEVLILADVGIECTTRVLEQLRKVIKEQKLEESEDVRQALKQILKDMMAKPVPREEGTGPKVVLIIGVNGVGKTTTIGKLAALWKQEGKKVLLAAGDTFRAAAADQLSIWAERAGVDIVRLHEGADPAAVIFDAVAAGKARKADVILCDTAGRLHNKKNLMNELAKIRRVIDRELPDAVKETWLILDATTGQNALSQAKEFQQVAGLTGLVITKLDGTAKGGIAIAVSASFGIPVVYTGLGEKVDDLAEFDPDLFIDALFE
jgi:fused signal recognition particle receptor